MQKNKLITLLGVVGLLLLLFTGLPTQKEEAAVHDIGEAYRIALTEDVRAVCAAVRGAGEVRVLLTLSSGEIAVYEKNQNGDNESIALAGGDSLLVTYQTPAVLGVAVVCEGGADATVRAELTALLRATLGVDTRNIHIAPLK